MKNISPELKAHLKQPTATITTCWNITRRDGKSYYYTELDRDIEYNGRTYSSTGGFNKSSLKSSGSLSIDNSEVSGFLSDDTIPDIEIRNGSFDYAAVQIFMINYEDTSMGELKLRTGYFGEVKTMPSGAFLVELRGLIQLLTQTIGEIYVPECRVDLGSTKCGIALQPEERVANKQYVLGDRILAPTESFIEVFPSSLGIINGDFSTGDLTGWSNPDSVHSEVTSGDFNLMHHEGDFYLYLTTTSHSQTHSIDTTAISEEAIDAEEVWLRLNYEAASYNYKSQGVVHISFLNTVEATIEVKSFHSGIMKSSREFHNFLHTIKLPADTRSIRITFDGEITEDLAQHGWCVANVNAELYLNEFEINYSVYGGVEFECTTAGITASITPIYDSTIGVTTSDGTASFTAKEPNFTFLGTVDTIVNAQKIIGLGHFTAKDENFFSWGWIEFLDGPNKGLYAEIQSSNAGLLSFVRPLPRSCDVGDSFRLAVGCDRTRGTCIAKFDNILNFRGEPDIPGNGEYFRIAGTGR